MNIKIDLTKQNCEIFGIAPERGKELLAKTTLALELSLTDSLTNKVAIIARTLQAVDTDSLEEVVYITYCVAHKLGQIAAVKDGMVKLMAVEKVRG